MGQIQPHDGVARLQHRGVSRLIGLRAGVRLHVDVFGAEKLLGAVAREVLHVIGEFAAAVVALAGIAFGVFVGEDAAGGFQHRFGGEVFAGDQFDLAVLAFGLLSESAGKYRDRLRPEDGAIGLFIGGSLNFIIRKLSLRCGTFVCEKRNTIVKRPVSPMTLLRLTGALSLIFAAAMPSTAQGPSWDNSGNGLIHGSYYFREVIYIVGNGAGDLSRALALYGNINFDGNGNYTISGAQALDASVGQAQSFSATGTYVLAASGYGFFSNPLSSATSVLTIHGLVSNGIIIGSDTEDGFNDFFVAAPLASPVPTMASFRGSYSVAAYLPQAGQGRSAFNANASFQLNPDGAGNLGAVNINGYFAGGGSKVYTQSTAALKYFYSNGAGVITFPASTTANFYASQQEYVYMSPDGNFIFGGSPLNVDFFVGVRTPAAGAAQPFGGIYYEAGIDDDASQYASAGVTELDTFYGSFGANGGNIVGHERLQDVFNAAAEGFTYAATYPAQTPGTYTSSSGSTQYTVANNGTIRIGVGVGPYLGINVALQAPALTGSGVFLNPTGIANAASAAPFTAGVSPGEFIVIYGTNLAPGTTVATGVPFPATLNGVQVTVNGIPAPLYYVSATQIAAIVPYGITTAIAQIQVTNNTVVSNSVTELVNKTTPGIFTLSANGLGYGAIEHASDGSVVSTTRPAQPGESVSVFLSGLGAVLPANPEGRRAPPRPSVTPRIRSALMLMGLPPRWATRASRRTWPGSIR